MSEGPEIKIYCEVVTRDSRSVDRFFLAPAGLGIKAAKEQRVSGNYRTREGAHRGLVARIDAVKQSQS